MSTRVAVVTDCLSPEFVFPIWYRYYSGLFGPENIFLITYAGLSVGFQEFKLGGLIELPVGYDDDTRRSVISKFVASILPCYDIVIRVDADEFLVVDPRVASSLLEFVENLDEPYMSARGFDVIQLDNEPSLPEKPDFPILRNRRFAYPNTALNKTCIVKIPVSWSPGFHWASVPPKFGSLFMLHMKRLDIGWQLGWFGKMSENIRDNPKVKQMFKDYYAPDEIKIRKIHEDVARRPRLSGIEAWYRSEIINRYLDAIEFEAATNLYHGSYGAELVLCEIPQEWKSIL